MIKAQYTRSLVMGLGLLIFAAVVLVSAITLLTQSLVWSNVLSLVPGLGFVLLGVIYVLRSRPSLTVDTAGVQQRGVGGWQLSWGEVRALEMAPSRLIFEPTAHASQRTSVSSAVLWSRMFAPGQRSRRAIALPQPRLDKAAWDIIRAHGSETDTSVGRPAR